MPGKNKNSKQKRKGRARNKRADKGIATASIPAFFSKGVDGITFNTLATGFPYMGGPFPDNKVYDFVQSFEYDSILASSNLGTQFYQKNWTTSDCSQFSSYAAITDVYRIRQIHLWIYPQNPVTPTGAAVNRGNLYSVIDYDDSTALASPQAAQEYANCVITPNNLALFRKFVPHSALAESSGGTSFSANVSGQWHDNAATAVPHYGLKLVATQSDNAADITTFNMIAKIWWQFKYGR